MAENEPDGNEIIDALVCAYGLKEEGRTGWQLRGIDHPESVAAHSWGMALLAWRFCPNRLDRERVLTLCLLHDIGESIVGDIPLRDANGQPPDERGEKVAREREAITGPLAAIGPDLRERWLEYEEGSTGEAQFVKDLDHLDACLQATVYREEGSVRPMDEFFETAEAELSTERGRQLFAAILDRYRRFENSTPE